MCTDDIRICIVAAMMWESNGEPVRSEIGGKSVTGSPGSGSLPPVGRGCGN